MDIKKFWDEGISYDEYLEQGREIIANPETQMQKDYLEYYKLGIQRMNRVDKTYQPDPSQLAQAERKNFHGKILAIAEQWCGDASASVPVIHKFFDKNEFRITYRDQEPSLINDYLTNGKSRSIPVFLFLDDDFKVINHWGPRPEFGKKLFAKHKNNPGAYDEERFHNDMQVYYAKNKGVDIVKEVLELL